MLEVVPMTSPVQSPLEAESRFVQREVVLLAVLAVLALGAFQITRIVANREQRDTAVDAAAWYAIGARQLEDGRVDDAIDSLRHAATRDRDNRTYRTALARALVAAGRREDARLALLELRESAPEDPQTNVELARLAAERKDVTEAARYYRSALYGVWAADGGQARVRLHVEFIRFLLDHDQRAMGLAELLALLPNLPTDPKAHVEAGQLLLLAGDAPRAREQFVQAITTEPRNRDAQAGAGEAAFKQGDYLAARRYLSNIADPPPSLTQLRELSVLILTSDPLAPRLTPGERQNRLVAAFTQAVRRLDECRTTTAWSGDLATKLDGLREEADVIAPSVQAKALRPSPEVIETGTDLVYRLEQETAGVCGTPTGLDEALLINGQRRGAQTQ
jgi:tetratricopeptide (TPR) repeat protein